MNSSLTLKPSPSNRYARVSRHAGVATTMCPNRRGERAPGKTPGLRRLTRADEPGELYGSATTGACRKRDIGRMRNSIRVCGSTQVNIPDANVFGAPRAVNRPAMSFRSDSVSTPRSTPSRRRKGASDTWICVPPSGLSNKEPSAVLRPISP
ncbi:MAG: hypothetical protein LW627_08580 [Ilumatobacteraceae bacterium]|nr:hypothetical protein [Ilumatobacteraceae bacterium]